MQVILKTNVDKLGREGDVINVADGYARNYLIPHKLAIEATEKNRRSLEHEKKVELDREVKHKKDAEKLASELANISCTIKVKAGENDQLFGSVTNADIAEVLAEQGYTVDKKKIILEEPIKELGVFTVPIKIYQDITTNIKVWVVKE
ncbi:TPA: 50S ribosomal protein L9 [Candidatus Poribacteria bacterium]|nr:50S ribosomal protein L9 [Candidatus Poribacteria bacterium]